MYWNPRRVYKRLRGFFWNLKLGYESNFPTCCIWYYSILQATRRTKEALPLALITPVWGEYVGYVRCPHCTVESEGYKRMWRERSARTEAIERLMSGKAGTEVVVEWTP